MLRTGVSAAEFREAFPDDASCAHYLIELRWPDGFICQCGGTQHASLKSRAFTYECLDCGLQTSITAGTVMHRSHLPLTKWFSAAHLLATSRGKVSTQELKERLKVAHQTALELKRKLEITEIPVDDESLRGVVGVAQSDINLMVHVKYHGKCVLFTNVAVALELSKGKITRPKASAARGFTRIRASFVRSSKDSIERFIRRNVRPGTILLAEDPYPFLELFDHGYELRDSGAMLGQARGACSAFEHWFKAQRVPKKDELDARLEAFVAETNWPTAFDEILLNAVRQKPTTYWQRLGRENPRKGAETVRRRPRRRKTANGMREDGSV